MMNGYQRIKAALNSQWPDRRPVMLHNFMMAAREAGLTMKEYRENPQKAARSHIQAVERYGLDGVLVDFDTATLAGAVGVGVDYPEDEPALARTPCLPTLDMVNELDPAGISKDERVQAWLETCRIVKNYFGDEIFVRGNCDQAPFSLACMMRSYAEWMTDLITGNELVSKLLDFCTDACLHFIRLMAETGVDMVSNGDSPAGPAMISPEMYLTFAQPYEKKLVEEAHRLGLPYALHICGKTDSILEAMVETGTDALELDYKTDIRRIHEVCKNKATLFGNIDPSGIICRGTPDDVQKKVLELLEVYRDSPRLVVNAGCAIPPDAPAANIERLVKTTKSCVFSKLST